MLPPKFEDTFSVEIVPVCKDNVICLSVKLAQKLGNMSQVCVVFRVTQSLHLIDPSTCQIAEVPAPVFWREPFSLLCEPRQLVEYVVMDIEHVMDKDRRHIAGHAQISLKHVLSDVWVVKSSEIGQNDDNVHCKTHLGHLLNIGDSVLGFDMRCANTNDAHLDKMKPEKIPDVVLVKKMYGDSNKRHRKRKWKLQHLTEETTENKEYHEFLEDLEEDPTYRNTVNIYKDSSKLAVDADDSSDDEGAPRISLAEMLDDLCLAEDATGEEGAAMMD